MPFKFNPFTGTLDVVNASSSTSSPSFPVYKVAVGVTLDIPDGVENTCSTVLTIDGILQITGKALVL